MISQEEKKDVIYKIRYNLVRLSEDVKVLLRSTINIYRPLLVQVNILDNYSEISVGSIIGDLNELVKEELTLYLRYCVIAISNFLGKASKGDVLNLDIVVNKVC